MVIRTSWKSRLDGTPIVSSFCARASATPLLEVKGCFLFGFETSCAKPCISAIRESQNFVRSSSDQPPGRPLGGASKLRAMWIG
jgi:hypothetical protein